MNHPHSADAEAERHAYNAAFDALGLSWHWDRETWTRLAPLGREALRHYLESEHAHLLRAYDAQFLVEAVEAARSRFIRTPEPERLAA